MQDAPSGLALSYLPQIFSGIEFTLLGHSQYFVTFFLIQEKFMATKMAYNPDLAKQAVTLSVIEPP
jgi:hypothetical protein